MTMTWNYRVMAREDELAIYEVHYYDDGRIRGYSAAPAFPSGATVQDLRDHCALYFSALEKPVLQYSEDD